MVVEAEFDEHHFSGLDSDGEDGDDEVADEDYVLDRENVNPQKASDNAALSIFVVRESKKTLRRRRTTDTLDCDNFLMNQNIDSVLNTVRLWISTGKLPTVDVEARQCKGLLGYTNPLEKLFIDSETQLVCRRSEHSSERICLPQNSFVEAFNVAHDHRLTEHPGSEKTLSLNPFICWP